MFHLYEDLPSSVEVDGDVWHLDLSFDRVLRAVNLLEDPEMTDSDRLEVFLNLLISGKEIPAEEDWEATATAIIDLIQPDAKASSAPQTDLLGNPMEFKPKSSEGEDYRFGPDDKYIYAAFWQTYHIDLMKERGHLHWLAFTALLQALPEDTMFQRICQIRSTDIREIKDSDERKRMKELQEQFALPLKGGDG